MLARGRLLLPSSNPEPRLDAMADVRTLLMR
jgi:hypothetical protein